MAQDKTHATKTLSSPLCKNTLGPKSINVMQTSHPFNSLEEAPLKPAVSNKTAYLFIICIFALLLIPFVGMPFAQTSETSENRSLASPPCLTNKTGTININILADAGAYFEDHFAFRSNLISANARLYAAMGTSATDQVVVGSHGWLFYAGTLLDYRGQASLSERSLHNIAHNLALLQGFAHAQGSQFVFCVAPNKNTLYPAEMPSNYLASPQASNWERLMPILDEYGVHYVNLFDVLKSAPETTYYKRDTHWNNRGALLGANAILKSLECPPLNIPEESWEVRFDYTGDIAKMLYPHNPGVETASYASGYNNQENQTGATWQWEQGQSAEEDFVRAGAISQEASGSLVMFRDSFANALIPYLASQFEEASFTKLVPYDAATISIQEADYCVVERAERHLDYLAQHAPIMPAPAVRLATELPAEDSPHAADTLMQVEHDGSYTVISGEIDETLWKYNPTIYVEVPAEDGYSHIYEASCTSTPADSPVVADRENVSATSSVIYEPKSDYGYVVYLPNAPDFTGKTVRVICMYNNEIIGVSSYVPKE